jgi:hypothetical protein
MWAWMFKVVACVMTSQNKLTVFKEGALPTEVQASLKNQRNKGDVCSSSTDELNTTSEEQPDV